MRTTVSIFGLALLVSLAPGQENPASKLPSGFGDGNGLGSRVPHDLAPALAQLRETHKVPAMAAAIIDRNGLIAVGVSGSRKDGDSTPVTLDDRWHLGSCGKAMTGTLASLLVKDGTLRWDSTIDEVFNPSRGEKEKITNNWRLVRLRSLTTCTANVPTDLGEYGGRPLWASMWEKSREGMPARDQRSYLFGELIKGNIGSPGYAFQYANASVALAGHMMETATQTPFEELIQQRLFRPLGIHSAGFGSPGTAEGTSLDQPWGHTRAGTPVPPGINADNPPSIAPAGTMHMSIGDWARFGQMHLIGAEISLNSPIDFDAEQPPAEPDWNKGATLGLDASDFAVLHAPGLHYNDYAAGWINATRPWAKGTQPGATGTCLTHVGSNTMWTASIWIAPEIGRGYLVVVNSGSNAGAEAREGALQQMIELDRTWREGKPK